MSDSNSRPRRKASKSTYTTKSGKTITVHRTLADRVRMSREARAQRKAAYLSTLPKEPWKRVLYRMHPRRLYQYWFSREGLIMALKIAGVSFVVAFLLVVGLFAYFRKDLPKVKDINSADSGGSIAYYDRTGKTLLFQDYDAFKRIPVQSNEISQYMKEATVAIEDKDFYHEGAFNVKGITRAAVNNATGGSTQGGSTITQQLVKLNEQWTNDHTISRKVKELILAVEVEREYNKDDILTAYLNLAPYSGLDYGVQAAAQDLFHTDASKLTLAQAAMLASIPKNPTYLSPYSSSRFNPAVTGNLFDQQSLIGRQQYVLDQMAKQGYITQDQANAAKQIDILGQVQNMPTSRYAGMKPGYAYAVQAAKAELARDFPAAGIKAGGWKVITTIDTGLQDLANKSLTDNANKLRQRQADDASFVSEDNATGEIVALVGGMDFNSQQLNFASDAPISPGSSVKPYSYAAFINNNNNVGAGSMLVDNQAPLPGYPCTNKNSPESSNPGNCLFDDLRKNYGNVTLRYALGSSLNIPAVKAFTSSNPKDTSTASAGSNWRRASINTTMSTINALMDNSDGYKCYRPGTALSDAKTDDEIPCDAAAGIGNEAYTTLADHVNGIASLARMGQAIPQSIILKVTNASGKTLPLPDKPKPKQVIKPDSAYIVTDMAADPGASYLNGHCTTNDCTPSGQKFHRYKGWHNAIKTGTNENLDGLMLSWNTKYTSGIWIGNYDRSAYAGSPELATDPIMKEFMEGAIDNLGNVKPVNWTQPSDIKTLPAFHSSVPFSTESQPPATDLFPSWYVGKTTGSSQTMDKVSGMVATSCTPPLARQTSSNTSVGQWNVDIFAGGSPNVNSSATPSNNSGTQPTDNVHNCPGDNPPDVTITAITVNGNNVTTCPATTGCTIMVHVDQGTHPLNDPSRPNFPGTLNLIMNGQTLQTQQISESGDYEFKFTPPANTTGGVQLEVQVTDSVLYQSTDTKTVTVTSTVSSRRRTPPRSGGGPGKDTAATLAGFLYR